MTTRSGVSTGDCMLFTNIGVNPTGLVCSHVCSITERRDHTNRPVGGRKHAQRHERIHIIRTRAAHLERLGNRGHHRSPQAFAPRRIYGKPTATPPRRNAPDLLYVTARKQTRLHFERTDGSDFVRNKTGGCAARTVSACEIATDVRLK